MDHHYIDEHSLADRYLDRALAPQESVEFEAHLVDCQECRDRLLLAEMFHARNGISKPSQLLLAENPPRIRLIARFPMLRLFLIFAAASALAILASVGLFFWAVRR